MKIVPGNGYDIDKRMDLTHDELLDKRPIAIGTLESHGTGQLSHCCGRRPTHILQPQKALHYRPKAACLFAGFELSLRGIRVA